jgi:stalled ribosome rescue protein Dom34
MSNEKVLHAAVWIDHHEAKVFQIELDGFEASKIKAPTHQLTRKAQEQGSHAVNLPYFKAVAEALKDFQEILVVGPSSAKLDFLRYVHQNDQALSARILGVETLDHPTDGQIVAYVRHYFHAKDQMLGRIV